ncbi:pyridoxamine 5'-phosphate oxidase family protein [Minwuia thermotolerans]|uniref:Flavin-nucleotide-binding protein n=1 Tax=Minwuia thermotolerans TaxID=2056226 RepID=A0A2M9G515_9PROT|nr:pyridoxamine 5'-phosphate oxidase family protein [Minwuia thermotolerans]PJK30790.1 flavin-nucleotide-binding protein [Minwuia thermotolerans]
MTEHELTTTDRTRLRRAHLRGHADRATAYAILDATMHCHVGYTIDGSPYVTPTFEWREGDDVFWHGSSASRALRAAEGAEVCLTVSLLDGLVLARSGFHHSVNYRSVMLFGRARKIEDPAEKTERLKTFVEMITPGRWQTLRPMTDQELKGTTILTMPIDEGAAKVRDGGPIDDEEDYALPIWAGVVPIRQQVGEPEPDPRNLPGLDVPGHVRAFRIG